MSLGISESIIKLHWVGLATIWLIKLVVPGGLTVTHLIYLYNWLHCFQISIEACSVPLFGPGDALNCLEDIF